MESCPSLPLAMSASSCRKSSAAAITTPGDRAGAVRVTLPASMVGAQLSLGRTHGHVTDRPRGGRRWEPGEREQKSGECQQ
jgi:hypothetical protein